jgi:CRP-like cAMP-binding protein
MTHWMCVNCGYYLQTDQPPDHCPNCKQACVFSNVTCYRPDCGGERNIDPLLVGSALANLTLTNVEHKASQASAVKETPAPITEILFGLSDAQKKKVRALGKQEIYDQGAIISRKGDVSPRLYLVEEGQAAVEAELRPGMNVPLTTVTEGQAFGWSVLVPPNILTATVAALSRVKVLAIEREPLMELFKSDPALGLIIMQNLASIIANRLHNVELEMTGLLKQSHGKF